MELTRPILILALQKLDRRSFVRFKEELSCWDVEEACRKILDLRLRDATPQIVGHQIRRYFGASYAIKLTQALLDSMNEKKIAEELQRDWEEGIMHPEQGNRMLPNDVLGTALRKLDRESFHRFKMVLNNVDVGISYKPIPMSLLDNANPESVAKLILYYYAIPHSVYVTWAVLEIINEKIIARELREDWDKECGGRLSIPSVACRIHLDQVPTSATVVGPDQSKPRTTEVDSSRIQEDRVENTRPQPPTYLTDALTCCICTNIYREPVTLPCGHNYCKECIDRTWEYQSKFFDNVACPECNVPQKKLPTLTKNLKLCELVEAHQQHMEGASNQE